MSDYLHRWPEGDPNTPDWVKELREQQRAGIGWAPKIQGGVHSLNHYWVTRQKTFGYRDAVPACDLKYEYPGSSPLQKHFKETLPKSNVCQRCARAYRSYAKKGLAGLGGRRPLEQGEKDA